MLIKKDLRQYFTKKRDSLDRFIRENYSKDICSNILKFTSENHITSLGAYYPIKSEVDISGLFDKKNNLQISLPKINEASDNIEFFEYNKDKLVQNQYHILEPVNTLKADPIHIIVPALSIDLLGHRLGYGKGYYDKYLAKSEKENRLKLAIGVCFETQISETYLPVNNLDFRLHLIITEKRIIYIRE